MSPGSGVLFVSTSNRSLQRYQACETKLSKSCIVPTQVTTHQIPTLWDGRTCHPKATFFQIGPLNCILWTIAKNECLMADKSFFFLLPIIWNGIVAKHQVSSILNM